MRHAKAIIGVHEVFESYRHTNARRTEGCTCSELSLSIKDEEMFCCVCVTLCSGPLAKHSAKFYVISKC